jgi:hypothetical protein
MKQLYITFQRQTEWQYDSHGNIVKDADGNLIDIDGTPLGYAAEYRECNKKTIKKNESQRDWAYESYIEKNGLIYEVSTVWEPYVQGQTNRKYIETLVKHQPKIIDNDVLQGFKIAKTVSRYTTSNKLWRILDPRGFELEISTANMEDILMNGSVDKGEIIGYYVWDFGKNGIGKAHLIKAKP